MKLAIYLFALLCAAQMSFGQLYIDGWLDLNEIHYEVNSLVSWYGVNMGRLRPSDIVKPLHPKEWQYNSLKFHFSPDYKTFSVNCTAVYTYYIDWTPKNPSRPYQKVVCLFCFNIFMIRHICYSLILFSQYQRYHLEIQENIPTGSRTVLSSYKIKGKSYLPFTRPKTVTTAAPL